MTVQKFTDAMPILSGPMRAGNAFFAAVDALPPDVRAKGARLAIEFRGAPARGGLASPSVHAALAGLLGEKPGACDADFVRHVLSDPNGWYEAVSELGGGQPLVVRAADLVCRPDAAPDALVFRLLGGEDAVILEKSFSPEGGEARA